MRRTLIGLSVAVSVAATVGLTVASGQPSRTLDDRIWTWSDAYRVNPYEIHLDFRRDVAGKGPLRLETFTFDAVDCSSGPYGNLHLDRVASVAVAATGRFSYAGGISLTGDVDEWRFTAKLTISGQVESRTIRGVLRVTDVYLELIGTSSRAPCQFDTGPLTFVASCKTNCPPQPPPPPSRLTTRLVPYRSIAGVALGMTRKQVLGVFGHCGRPACVYASIAEPVGSGLSPLGEGSALSDAQLRYSGTTKTRCPQVQRGSWDLKVWLRRDRVVGIGANCGDVKLASGVGIGSPLAAMRRAFPRVNVCTHVGGPQFPKMPSTCSRVTSVRCLDSGLLVTCFAQRLGPGSVLLRPIQRTCGPVGPGGSLRCYRIRVPKVVVTVFGEAALRGAVAFVTVLRCDPISNRAPGPGDGIPPGTKQVWEPCAPDFLTRQRKYAP